MEDREQIELLKKSILEGILMFRDVEYEILDDTFKNIDKKKPRFSSKEVVRKRSAVQFCSLALLFIGFYAILMIS